MLCCCICAKYHCLYGHLCTGTLPLELGQLPQLARLGIGSNSFTGAVPNSLCGVTSLTSIEVGPNTGLTCYPTCLTSAPVTGFTGVTAGCPTDQENGLCGFIAATDIQVTSGYSQWACDVSGYPSTDPCAAGGAVWPGLVCNGVMVEGIGISNVPFAGSIPPAIGCLSALTMLLLRSSSLGGSLPTTLGSLSELVVLSLGSNVLSGTLPSGVSMLTKLTFLEANSNMLGTTLPTFLGLLSALSTLMLGGNSFTGPIPPAIGNCSLLSVLNLEHNSLTGEVACLVVCV